ncbi:hypothetical protein AAFF27_07410 [Xylophilus sp. GW821-FHT01B05]
MLDTKLWLSFEKGLSDRDIGDIEGRFLFLKEALEDAISQHHVEDIRSDLDLNLHIYLQYFTVSGNENLSPWLIHDRWLYYYEDGEGVNNELRLRLGELFCRSMDDLYERIKDLLGFLDDHRLIFGEADAVVWLSFTDYLASQLIAKIGRDRFQVFLGSKGE